MSSLIPQYYRYTKRHTTVAPPVEPEEPQGAVTLAAPTNLTATQEARLVTMNWEPNAPGANQLVESREDGGAYTSLGVWDDATATRQFVASDTATVVDMRVKALGDGTTTLDSGYATASLVIPKQLAATQELNATIEGKTFLVTFQPDGAGAGQELRIKNLSTQASEVIPLTIDDYQEEYEADAYATDYSIEHRTLGDGVAFLNSAWVLITRTTEAAPVPVTPTASFTSAYDETDPTKLVATYEVSLSPAPTVKTFVNVKRSNANTGVVEQLEFTFQAGQTTPLAPVYNFIYANLNPDKTEVYFQTLAGEGYTPASMAAVTHALNYTPPGPAPSLLATESAYIRDGEHAVTNYATAPSLELKTAGALGFTRYACIGWSASIAGKPTTLKLYVENYATVSEGTVEVYAMTGGFDPATDNWNTLIGKKGALLGSVNYSPVSPYLSIDLGAVTAAGEYNLMLVGTGYASGTPYNISKAGSANPPTLAETVVSEKINIKTYGTVGAANDQAVLLAAVADTQAKGKVLLIDETTVVNLPLTGTEIFQSDVQIELAGIIRCALKTHSRANDWKYQGILDKGSEYIWSNNTATVDYQKRQASYKSAYNALLWSGRRGRITGRGKVDGSFDNTQLNTWGAMTSPALMKVTGDGFTGELGVANGGGNGLDITSEGAEVVIYADDCGYNEVRLNVTRPIAYASISVIGGKSTTKPNVRLPGFTINGSAQLTSLNMPIVSIRSGMLIEGAVYDDNPNATTTYYQEVNIGLMDLHPDIPMTYQWGDPASYSTGKFENTGIVNITEMLERSTLQNMGAFWFDKLAGKLTITKRDSTLAAFRVALDTHIGLNIQTRDSAYQPQFVGWVKITKPVVLTYDEFRIENNGYGDMAGTFGIFDMLSQSPSIHIKSLVNNGGAKILLARYNSGTGSGSIKVGVGLSVAQQLSYLAARNISVPTAMQRLLAAS